MRPLRRGARIAPGYEVLAHLRRGNDLDVYDAWSDVRGCRVIAKALRPDRRRKRSAAERLVQEGSLLCELSHPHVVRGYELIAGPPPVVIMETLTGRTLGHLIEHSARRLPAAQVAQLGLQLCSAVGYLHGQGWLHLDLKPSNIVAEAGRAKLIDLSIARRPGPAKAGLGTWCYMAPEQARGGELGPAADVWGVGAVLWEAATGEPPFDEDEEPEYPQLTRRVEPVRRLRRLPGELTEAIDASLEPDPDKRPVLPEIEQTLARVHGVQDPRA